MKDKLHKRWVRLLERLKVDNFKSDIVIFEVIYRAYSEGHRKYHNVRHLCDVLMCLDRFKHLLYHPDLVELALFYHDIVYEIGSGRNEVLSVELFDDHFYDHLSDGDRSRVKSLIMATEIGSLPERYMDCNYIADIDKAMMGGDPDDFKRNSLLIHEEYNVFSDNEFYEGRRKILMRLLNEGVYKTRFFEMMYGNVAIQNINEELKKIYWWREANEDT